MNGVVGNTGNTAPAAPRAKKSQPPAKRIDRLTMTVYFSSAARQSVTIVSGGVGALAVLDR